MKFSLKGIIAISGKPGLYKVIAQGNNNLIVESLIDKKRSPAHSSNKISALDEITMYTTGEEDKPLPEIIQAIFEKENGGNCIDPKDEANHRDYFKQILPDYDEERVYRSDIKKLFSWYTLLLSAGELTRIAEEAKKAAEEESSKEKAEEKKTAKKKAAEAEKAEEKSADTKKEKPAKKTPAKAKTAKADVKPKVKADSKAKTPTVRKTGGQRGA